MKTAQKSLRPLPVIAVVVIALAVLIAISWKTGGFVSTAPPTYTTNEEPVAIDIVSAKSAAELTEMTSPPPAEPGLHAYYYMPPGLCEAQLDFSNGTPTTEVVTIEYDGVGNPDGIEVMANSTVSVFFGPVYPTRVRVFGAAGQVITDASLSQDCVPQDMDPNNPPFPGVVAGD